MENPSQTLATKMSSSEEHKYSLLLPQSFLFTLSNLLHHLISLTHFSSELSFFYASRTIFYTIAEHQPSLQFTTSSLQKLPTNFQDEDLNDCSDGRLGICFQRHCWAH